MRGSTELLQFSYKIHVPIIKSLYEEYQRSFPFIYNYNEESYINDLEGSIDKIDQLTKNIMPTYKNYAEDSNSQWTQTKYNTLSTKILLGVFGITPAFDQFLQKGLKHKGLRHNLSKESLHSLIDFYKTNISFFKIKDQTLFPPMKLIDIYFWQLGFDLKDEEKKNKQNKITQ
ncbi:MAG: hypothetical protein ACRCVW_00490 [Brevinema sp.]